MSASSLHVLLGRTPELGLRALLRNLRLLSGMRASGAAARAEVVIAGTSAPAVAAALSALEPTLAVAPLGSGGLRSLAGRRLASLIFVQPLHTLRARDELRDARLALDDEDGTLGMIWARAPTRGWISAFSDAAGLADGAFDADAAPTQLPPLARGESPMAWVDALGVADYGFHSFKHRKFVEQGEGVFSKLSCGRAAPHAHATKACAPVRNRPGFLTLRSLPAVVSPRNHVH